VIWLTATAGTLGDAPTYRLSANSERLIEQAVLAQHSRRSWPVSESSTDSLRMLIEHSKLGNVLRHDQLRKFPDGLLSPNVLRQ
jgi:hypothetical protein